MTPLLFVGNFLSSSRAARSVCEDLSEQLTKRGWPVITTSRVAGRVGRLIDMVRTAWLGRDNYSVAHVDVFSGPAFVWAEAVCAACHWAGRPYILTLHGGDLPAFAQRWPRRVRRLLTSAAAVTTPSPFLCERLSDYRSEVNVIPNPLAVDAFEFRWRRRLSRKLIWVRAFHEIYEPSLAPGVLKLLGDDFPDLELTMLGPDKGDGSLQRVIDVATTAGVRHLLNLPGGVPRNAIPQWLAANDIFLNTSNIDNTPVSIMEAMASGLCIVSTNVGGIPYLLRDGQDALLVPPRDPEAMALVVRRLLTEPGLAERLSQNARKKAEAFDWPAVLPQWERLFSTVASSQAS